MASFDVLHNSNDVLHNSSGSFQSGEYSFLPEVSVPSEQNGVIFHINENLDMTNMQSALATASPDISMEDIHGRLVELLLENESLKDSLNRNNVLMRDKVGTISSWREQMIQAKNKQFQSLERAKKQISSLKEENADLQEQLSTIEKECQELKNPVPCEKCKTTEETMQTLQNEKDSAEKVKSILVGELQDKNKLQEHLRQNLAAIHHYLNNLLHDRKISKKEREELNGVIQSLTAEIITLNDGFHANVQTDEETGYVVVNKNYHLPGDILLTNSNEAESLKQKLEETNEELNQCKIKEKEMCEKNQIYMMRILELENQMELNQLEIKEALTHNSLKRGLQEKENKVSSCKEVKSLFTEAIDVSLIEKYKERCESLQQEVVENHSDLEKLKISYDQSMEKLRGEAKNLQDILKLEQRSNQKDKEKLAEVMEKCEKLQVDYDRATQLLEIHMKDEKKMNEEQSNERESLAKSHMEEMDHLTAHLFDVQDKLAQRSEEVKALTQELASLREDAGDIPLLKDQIQYFKTDLEQAILTRDAAFADILKLESELKKYKRRDSDSASSRRKSSGSKKDHTEEYFPPLAQQCPVCQKMVFSDMKELENHVNQCLESSQA